MRRIISLTSLALTLSIQVVSQTFNFDSLNNLINSKTDTSKISALYVSAFNLSKDYPDSALKYGHRAMRLSQEIDFERGIAESNNNIGAAHITKSNFDSAVFYYKKSLGQYQKLDHKKGQATALNNLGHIEQQRGNYQAAAEYLMQAIQVNEDIGNTESLGSNYINLGIVLSYLKENDKALMYYKKAIPIKIAANDHYSLGNIYNNIGVEFRAQKQNDSTLFYYNKSIYHRKKAKDHRSLAASYSNLGILYFFMGKKDSTLALFNSALETYMGIGDLKEIARTHYNIAELHKRSDRIQLAKQNLKKSLEYAQKANSKEQIKEVYLGLAEASAKSNEYKAAYDFRIQYENYKDSLLNLRNKRAVTEINTKYETAKKDGEIASLKIEQQTAALELANSRNQRNIFIGLTALFVILAGLSYMLFRQKRKSLLERETLLKEIHHRVKNNLQIISSLLNLQAGSLENEAAIEAVKEGQHRVKSMALIHQRLYTADDIRGVDVQSYLENLVDELFKAFGVDREKVEFNVDSGNIKLDIDTVIPLGLIINELITNTLKYAFEKTEEGLLQIHMKEENDQLSVLVKDNGIGMTEEAMTSQNSFGWKMIKSLGRKLKAKIDIINDQGTTVQMTLSRYKLLV